MSCLKSHQKRFVFGGFWHVIRYVSGKPLVPVRECAGDHSTGGALSLELGSAVRWRPALPKSRCRGCIPESTTDYGTAQRALSALQHFRLPY